MVAQRKWTKGPKRFIIGKKEGSAVAKIDAQLGVRVTKDLKNRLEQQARKEMSSVSALVVRVMEDYLASQETSDEER